MRRWSASNPTRRARWWRFLLLDPAGPDPVPGADVEWEHRLALDPFGEAAVSLLLLGPPTR